MEKLVKVNCGFCKIEFSYSKKSAKYILKKNINAKFYCSKECIAKAVKIAKVKLTCDYCKIKFFRTENQIRRTKKENRNNAFCSRACCTKFLSIGRETKGLTKTVNCYDCSKLITISHHAQNICDLCKIKRKIVNCNICHKSITISRYAQRICDNCKLEKKIQEHRPKCKEKDQNKICIKFYLCIKCDCEIESSMAKYCDICRKGIFQANAYKNIQAQGDARRSKNEIHFANLCIGKFPSVIVNEPIFDGWDADVILQDHKIAVLWNGNWHYQKITKKHSVKQVQSRERYKLRKIKEAGYTVYIIADRGKENPKFVEQEFDKFVKWIDKREELNKL